MRSARWRAGARLWISLSFTILLLTAAASCGSDEPATQSLAEREAKETQIESEINELTNDLAFRCGLSNGIDESELRTFLDTTLDIAGFGPPSGLTGPEMRSYVSETGYGVVLSTRQLTDLAAQIEAQEQDSDPEAEASIRQVMETGPIRVPSSNAPESSGCLEWAREEIRAEDRFAEMIATREERSLAIATDVEESAEMAQINDDWSICMQQAGYPELLDITGGTAQAFMFMESLMRGDMDFDTALAAEIALGLADFDCRESVEVEARRRAIFDTAYQDFVTGE